MYMVNNAMLAAGYDLLFTNIIYVTIYCIKYYLVSVTINYPNPHLPVPNAHSKLLMTQLNALRILLLLATFHYNSVCDAQSMHYFI